MNKRIFTRALFVAALIMMALPMASARADCAADIEKTREMLNKANIAFAGTRDSIQGILDRARQKLDDGKKRGCAKLVDKAQKIIAVKDGAE